MPYDRSLAIEKRLQEVLDLVRAGRHATPGIAEVLGVSVPTVSRDVTALRNRGYLIRAERRRGEWRYVLGPKRSRARHTGRHANGRTAVTV